MSARRIVPPSMRYKAIPIQEYRKVYEESIRKLEEFWGSEADMLRWSRKWSSIKSGEGPNARWFTGGLLSPFENIIGKHRGTSLWGKPALIGLDENGDAEAVSYAQLEMMVAKIHCALENLGLRQGDWVVVYSPPTLDAFAFMLAAIRAGLPFEPVFTGFSPYEMYRRVITRNAKALFVTARYMRRGKNIDVLGNSKSYLERLSSKGVLVILEGSGNKGVFLEYDDLLEYSCNSREVVVDSNHKLFGLHSGYAEDFKPITHAAGGFLVQAYSTSRWIGLRSRDTVFCTVWPGWITGVTYQLFGPLMLGSTVLLYNGGPDWPSWSRWLDIIDAYAVTVFITTGSAIRILAKQDPSIFKSKNDTLREIIITAEPLEPEFWYWSYEILGTLPYPIVDSQSSRNGSIPVLDMYIQSEVGTFLTGNLVNYTFTPIEPGSAGLPFPGFAVDVVDDSGIPVRGKTGKLVIRSPWPSTPVEAPQEFYESWNKGYYETGDLAVMSDSGYIYPAGRADAILKVSGYRLSPGAVEKSIMSDPTVEWALTVPMKNPDKFETPLVIYYGKAEEEEIVKAVREKVGPIATPERVVRLGVRPSLAPSAIRQEIAKVFRSEDIQSALRKLEFYLK